MQFVQYCEDHRIIPLCLPPHATHLLQPLDLGIFGPLAKAYKTIVRNKSPFGASRINNEQFLQYFQEARRCIVPNIGSAWRAAGLRPFNPEPILARARPKSPPIASFTNEDGVTIKLVATEPTLIDQINRIVAALEPICTTPPRRDVTFYTGDPCDGPCGCS